MDNWIWARLHFEIEFEIEKSFFFHLYPDCDKMQQGLNHLLIKPREKCRWLALSSSIAILQIASASESESK